MRWWPLLIMAPLWGCGTKVIATDDPPMAGELIDYPACAVDQPQMGDACLGATPQGRCQSRAWTQGVSCSAVHEANETSIAVVLSGAEPGSCIDLDAGSYGQLVIPEGVSLLGRGWDCVSTGQITVTGGGTAIRGLTAPGVTAVSGGHLELRQLVLEKGSDGVTLEAGTSATLEHVTVRRSSRYGVSAFDAGDLTVRESLFEKLGGPGIWMQCGEYLAACPSTLVGTLERTRIEGAAIVGLSMVNVEAHLDHVDIVDTTVGANFEAGAGVSLVGTSLDVRGLRVIDAADVGVLCADCTGTIGAAGEDDAVVIRDNLRGFWAIGSGAPGALNLRNVIAENNLGVGLAADGPVQVTIADSIVRSTQLVSLPVLVNGVSAASAEVGDGILWSGGASMKLSGISVGNSARVPVLINGAVGPDSSIEDIELVDGDDAIGIVHQNHDGSSPPTIGQGVPALTEAEDELYPVAAQSCFGDC